MNRFFIPRPLISGNNLIMEDEEQVHHIKNVLRLKAQEPVAVFDEAGNEYNCSILKIGENITLRIKSRRIPGELNAKLRLTIACAIPKKSKFDDIVDKLTQLGVYRIIPLKTERVVVKLDKRKEELRSKRWNKIALSASQQSQRNNIPVVEPVQKIEDLLTRSKDFDLKLISTLAGRRKSLPEVITLPLPMAKILVLIGPEGDFSGEEVRSAKKAGFIPVTLGDLVLRVDTAAIAIASFIRFTGMHESKIPHIRLQS